MCARDARQLLMLLFWGCQDPVQLASSMPNANFKHPTQVVPFNVQGFWG